MIEASGRTCARCTKAARAPECAPGTIHCTDLYQVERYRPETARCNLTVQGFQPVSPDQPNGEKA